MVLYKNLRFFFCQVYLGKNLNLFFFLANKRIFLSIHIARLGCAIAILLVAMVITVVNEAFSQPQGHTLIN